MRSSIHVYRAIERVVKPLAGLQSCCVAGREGDNQHESQSYTHRQILLFEAVFRGTCWMRALLDRLPGVRMIGDVQGEDPRRTRLDA